MLDFGLLAWWNSMTRLPETVFKFARASHYTAKRCSRFYASWNPFHMSAKLCKWVRPFSDMNLSTIDIEGCIYALNVYNRVIQVSCIPYQNICHSIFFLYLALSAYQNFLKRILISRNYRQLLLPLLMQSRSRSPTCGVDDIPLITVTRFWKLSKPCQQVDWIVWHASMVRWTPTSLFQVSQVLYPSLW